MKRILLALSVLLLSVSCGKNGLYISVDNTCWEYTLDDQTAWVCFQDDEQASIVQANYGSNNYQTMHGTYVVDGHRVEVTTGSKLTRLIRTFSHLKNSSSKNIKSVMLDMANVADTLFRLLSDIIMQAH